MKFTERHVAYVCNFLQSKYPNKDCDFYKFGLAIEILRVLIENEWVNQIIFHNNHQTKTSVVRETTEFLNLKENGFTFQERIYRFAARLYDLQGIPNISRVITTIKTGNLIGAYAEIEAGRHLHSRGIQFNYVLTQGIRGKDFDIEIHGDPKVNCEVKHKIESTVLTKGTLEKTFSSAKSQVPNNEPSLFFIKIPHGWIMSVELERALGSFFPRSLNVIGIIFRWQEVDINNKGIFFWKYFFKTNPHHSQKADGTAGLVEHLMSGPTKPIQLDEMLKKYIKVCQGIDRIILVPK